MISNKPPIDYGDNLHEVPNPIFWENKKNIVSLSSADFAQRVLKG